MPVQMVQDENTTQARGGVEPTMTVAEAAAILQLKVETVRANIRQYPSFRRAFFKLENGQYRTTARLLTRLIDESMRAGIGDAKEDAPPDAE